MSDSSKKQDIDKPVFDSGALRGIGHNQGPPLDDPKPEPDTEVIETRPLRRGARLGGSQLTKEALEWMRAKEKSGELEKVVWNSPYGSDVVHNYELRIATGAHRSKGGKWIAHDGVVSRRGYRRIVPHADDKAWLSENNINALRQAAARVLHGRNATIFENCIINPLLDVGNHKTAVQAMAAQFGITDTRVYKILDKCKQRVKRASRGETPAIKAGASGGHYVREYIEGKPILLGPGPVKQDGDGRFYIEYWVSND